MLQELLKCTMVELYGNTEVKKINDEPKAIESKYNNISIWNKYRLGTRNTFNILTKFVLLFAVFFFMSAAILAEYASFQMSEAETKTNGYSIAFRDLSEKRILINKKDRTPFVVEDYEKIKSIDNVDYVVEDDIFIDGGIPIAKGEISFYGSMFDIENLRGDIDFGRKPENDDEILLVVRKDHFYIKNRMDDILNKTFSIQKSAGLNAWTNEGVRDVTIVGIKIDDNENATFDAKFYAFKGLVNESRRDMNKSYSDMKVMFNNKYQQYSVEPSDKVESGKAIVDDEFKYQFKNYKIQKQPLSIYVENLYYKEQLDLTVSNTYTKSNFKKLIGKDKYDNNRYTIFINTNDYNALFDKPSYQSSVYVKDEEKIEDTLVKLENLGLNPKKVTDFKVNEGEIYQRIIKIIKVVVTIVLIIVLFFISYLIIRIILKSRNVYYTTLRMLGATYKNVRRILDIELFINSTLSYVILLAFIYATKNNIIHLEHIAKLSMYLSAKEYILMYIVIIAISRLISIKFAKKLFKNTAINTYNEEV